jgi:putative DNA primase/helicase
MEDISIYHEVIRDYIDHGFSPVPIPYKTKAPIIKGWTKLSITAENLAAYFDAAPTNIGILTGEPSGGLVDIDLDDLDALKFAPWFLPRTHCIFGRQSKPRSHWIYQAHDAENIEQFTSNGMILELRGNNRCTVFPPSVHPSGELVEFHNPDDYEPASATWTELKRAAAKIAIATELYKFWPAGTRHELTLAIAATLARLGWAKNNVVDLITAIATEAQDDELADRLEAVETTFAEYSKGRPISGEERLNALVGSDVAENVRRWAGSLGSRTSQPHLGAVNPSPPTDIDLSNDSAAADAFASAFDGKLIYCNEQWFQRNNQIFEAVAPEIVQGLAKSFFQAQVERQSFAPKTCLGRSRINAAVELSRARFHLEPNQMDGNIDVVGCENGSMLDLITGSRVPNGTGYLTRKLGASLEASTSCLEWTKFLTRIFDGDPDLIGFVQRALGYTLTGSVAEQCMFILIGTGANGKSTFLKALHHLFGDYAASVPMAALMEQKNGSAQTNDLAYLVGKRFVTASEGERGQRLAESKIKMMTGGDRISCRALYKDYSEFDPQFKLWLATNNLPNITGMDEAIWRRIMVIPFPVTIPPEERDRELGARLVQELPAILDWAIQGLRDWRQQGLSPPSRVLQSTKTYRDDNDTVGQWIEAACIVEPRVQATMKELYESYKSWCENSAAEPMQNNSFGKELTRRGFESFRWRSGNGRTGIALKPSTAANLKVA